MSFHEKLEHLGRRFRERLGPHLAEAFALDLDALDGVRRRALREGETFPGARLADQEGRLVDLHEAYRQGPVLLTFYRGGWCPFCRLALGEFEAAAQDAAQAGVQAFAVSPEQPRFAQDTMAANGLSFGILYDEGGRLADAAGVRVAVPPDRRAILTPTDTPLPDRNGDESWTLPLPATYVIERGGRIAFAHIDPDFRRRLSRDEIKAALARSLAQPAAG
ncbi:peroxiredoxin-like family protein [Alsobacter sp. SYSU BS001988]|jgi:peroxiredoxin